MPFREKALKNCSSFGHN